MSEFPEQKSAPAYPAKINKDLRQACVDCSKDFILTEGEQKFYQDKHLYLPKRCPACRKLKKAKKLGEEESRGIPR